MFKFLFVIFFFFILLVFLMGFSILRTFKNIFFGSGNSTRKGEQRRQTNSNTSGHRSTTTTARDDDDDRTPYVHRKKIFAKDEGEYVDYEEVKYSLASLLKETLHFFRALFFKDTFFDNRFRMEGLRGEFGETSFIIGCPVYDRA